MYRRVISILTNVSVFDLPRRCADWTPLAQVFHPNLDLEGNICLNILREDWKPVLTINSVVYGLNHLFLVRC